MDLDCAEGFFRLGLSNIAMNAFKEAIDNFNEAERLEDKLMDDEPHMKRNPGIHDGHGQCNHALLKYEEALRNYDKAIEMQGDNTEFLMNRAQC